MINENVFFYHQMNGLYSQNINDCVSNEIIVRENDFFQC